MRPPLCRKKNEAPDQCVLLPKHNDECATVRSAVLCAIGLFSHMTVPSYLAGALSRVMRGVSPDNDKERVTVRSAVPCIPCPPAQSSRSQWPACPGRPRLAASQPEAGGTRLQHRKERHQPLAEWQEEEQGKGSSGCGAHGAGGGGAAAAAAAAAERVEQEAGGAAAVVAGAGAAAAAAAAAVAAACPSNLLARVRAREAQPVVHHPPAPGPPQHSLSRPAFSRSLSCSGLSPAPAGICVRSPASQSQLRTQTALPLFRTRLAVLRLAGGWASGRCL